MADLPTHTAKVLFVDDDMSFLQMLRDVFGNASAGAWDIVTATSGGDALQRLRSKRMDLAVVDVFMPGMDGLQLLRLLDEEFPSLPKVLLTGMPDGNTRAAALEGGAALFLEKPASAAGYESVFATLNELLRWHQRFSSHGALKRLGLLDVVKLECKSGNSRIFEVFAGDVRGEIFIKEGVIIHAIMPDRRGQSAFTYLTTTPGAVFYLRQYVEPIERSVDRQWEFLVMESAHVLAQLAELPPTPEESEPAAVTEAPVVPVVPVVPVRPAAPKPAPEPMIKKAGLPPPPPRVASPAVPPPVVVALPEVKVQPREFKAGSPGPTTLETQGAEELILAPAPDALPFETLPSPEGLKVEELLLCSEFREVLHAVNCVDANRRMRLAEAMAQKAHAFAKQLPMGELERGEMNSTISRMVLRYDAKRCVLVRTNTKTVQPPGDTAATEAPDEWLARQPEVRGVLAMAVATHDGRMFHRSFAAEFPEDVTQVVARESSHLPDLALRNAFPAWLVRFLYTRAQLYVCRRQDGALLVVFLLRSGVDPAAMEKFLAGFASMRAV